MAGSLEEAKGWLGQANRTLKAAEVLERTGFYAEAVSCAYYAMFYAAKAALALEGVAVSRHSAVIAAFGRIFAASGRVPTRLHKALIEAFDERGRADYSPGWQPSDEDTARRIAVAWELLHEVERLLTSE